jgi:alpha-N-arabinofuranosidase
VVDDESTGRTAVFALNRHLTDEMEMTVELRGLGRNRRLVDAQELYHANMKATNTREAPETVTPVSNSRVEVQGEQVKVRLKPGSWNVIVTESTDRAIRR